MEAVLERKRYSITSGSRFGTGYEFSHTASLAVLYERKNCSCVVEDSCNEYMRFAIL